MFKRKTIHRAVAKIRNGINQAGNSKQAPFSAVGSSGTLKYQGKVLTFLDHNLWEIGAPTLPGINGCIRSRVFDRCWDEVKCQWRPLIVFCKVRVTYYRYLGTYRFQLDGKGKAAQPEVEYWDPPHTADSWEGKKILKILEKDDCVPDALGYLSNKRNWARTPLIFDGFDKEFFEGLGEMHSRL